MDKRQEERYNDLLRNREHLKPGETWEEHYIKSYEESDKYRDSSPGWPEKEQRKQTLALCRELDEIEKKERENAEIFEENQGFSKAEVAVSPSKEVLSESPSMGILTADRLDAAQRWAKLYLCADVIPADWLKGDQKTALARIVVCLQLAEVKSINPLILLQNIDFIAGRLCWKSTCILQLLRAAGWRSYSFRFVGDPRADDFWADDKNGCAFCAKNPESGEQEEGTFISVGMVKKEGWKERKGSKWQSMAEQMFKYRAAAFFCRSNAPEILAGFYSQDEVADIVAAKND